MPTLNGEATGLTLLAFEGSVLSFSAWLPSGFTIRTFGDSALARRDLQHAMAIGTAFNIIMGIGTAVLAKSPYPLYGALAGSILGIIVYHWFMTSAHGMGSMKTQNTDQGAW